MKTYKIFCLTIPLYKYLLINNLQVRITYNILQVIFTHTFAPKPYIPISVLPSYLDINQDSNIV